MNDMNTSSTNTNMFELPAPALANADGDGDGDGDGGTNTGVEVRAIWNSEGEGGDLEGGVEVQEANPPRYWSR